MDLNQNSRWQPSILSLIGITFQGTSCLHSLCVAVFIFILNIPTDAQAKERIHSLIQSGVDSGARLLLDGRSIVVMFISWAIYTFVFFLIFLPLQDLIKIPFSILILELKGFWELKGSRNIYIYIYKF